MKRTLILLLVLVAMAMCYYFLVVKKDAQPNSSIQIDDREFVVENEEDIHVITIKSQGYPLVHLSRSEDIWLLNQRYKASENVVDNMLSVLTEMRLNYIPPKSQMEMIQKSIENVGMEIKTYDKDGNILSDFIMAGNTNKEDGTYCIKRDASQPYVMSMPVVEGGLRNYFNMELIAMRDKTMVELDVNKIKLIKVDYPKDITNSYQIRKDGRSYIFEPRGVQFKSSGTFSDNIIQSYVRDFNVLKAEYISTDNPARDTIKNRLAFAEILIQMEDNRQFKMDFFPDQDIYDRTVNTVSIENLGRVDRYFVDTSWGEFYTVQHRLISKWLRTPKHFLSR
ncbi:MAG: hypothetical protein HKN09_11515 [Saprospiraceae bacterium]|nr:hypothetical protein [Saprospiraceae bacterium]